jgi:hypothetical protein
MPKPSHERDVLDCREMPCDHNSLLPDRKGQAIVTSKLDQKASSPQHRPCSFDWYGHGNLPHVRAGECPSRSSRKARTPWGFRNDCVRSLWPGAHAFLSESSVWPNYPFETRPNYGFMHNRAPQTWEKWAHQDSNLEPRDYESPALTD